MNLYEYSRFYDDKISDPYAWVDDMKMQSDKRIVLSERERIIFRTKKVLPDVTDAELSNLIYKLNKSQAYYDARRLEKLYIDVPVNSERNYLYIQEICCVDPKDHRLEYYYERSGSVCNRKLLIDGLPVDIWNLIFSDKHVAVRITHVKRIFKALRKYKREDLNSVVAKKYKILIHENNLQFARELHLPETIADYEFLLRNKEKIFGLPISLWRALNQDDYIPQKTHLKVWIRQFESEGNMILANELKDKFDFILNPSTPKPFITDCQIQAARENLRRILSYKYSKEIIASARKTATPTPMSC